MPDHMYVPAYECVESLETLIQPEPVPLTCGMQKMPQYSLIYKPGISSCPGDAGEIWGNRATMQHYTEYSSMQMIGVHLLVTAQTPV